MEFFGILKKLRSIKPDPAYTEISRRAILATDPRPAFLRGIPAFRTAIAKILETGVAVALTGFFVLLLTGAFSGTGLSPQYSAVNPDALRAEAQAIDIQIQLSKLSYAVPPGEPASTLIQAVTTTPQGVATATIAANAAPGQASTSTATDTVTIDQALQGLAQ